MKTYDFIPANDRAFLQWTANFLKQLESMLTRIGFPDGEYQFLSSQCDDFAAKLTLAEEPATRTKVAVSNKNAARKLLEKTIRRAVCNTPPQSIDELIHSTFDTHTPFTVDFDENQRGQKDYFILRRENTRGEKGPRSEIVSAVIP
jgi:hypothetical protein